MSFRLSTPMFALLSLACVFDPKNTEGLPCNVDEECGDAFACIEHVCGGPDTVSQDGGSSGDESSGSDESAGSESDGAPVPTDPEPDRCTAEQTECLDGDVLRQCGSDGKLRTFDCRNACGPFAKSHGCLWSDSDDTDACACGPTHAGCDAPSGWTCDGQPFAVSCDGTQTQYADCDDVCADGGSTGAYGCELSGGEATCQCDFACLEGAQRCDSASTIAGCWEGFWQPQSCTKVCQDNGWESSFGCVFAPEYGDSVCQCW